MGVDSMAVGGWAVWIGAIFLGRLLKSTHKKLSENYYRSWVCTTINMKIFLQATSFIESNCRKYPFEDLIEKVYTLEYIEEAFAFAKESKPLRVGIKINI